MLDPLVAASATELAHRLRTGAISSVEVVSAHLDRIDEVDAAINAIPVRRDPEAVLADAAQLDALDEPAGPLHGLPVAVKDLENVAGLPTSSGSTITSRRPVRHDGLVAARLRAAGAVIIGKTNTPEFGAGSHTFNPVHGLTRNPWNTDRSAGGSSGGAAAALAARMVPIADGSDLGGSLRNPAAFNNVVGLRPSIGRVPVVDAASHRLVRLSVQGPMGRTVADTALVLSALAGADPRDPFARHDDPHRFADPMPETTDATVAWIGDVDGAFGCDTEPMALARAAADLVAAAGGRLVERTVELPGAERIFRVVRGLGFAQLGREIPADRHDHLKETIRQNIAFGEALTIDDVTEVESLRADLHRHLQTVFAEVDVLALPTTQVVPFPADQEFPTEVGGEPMADYLSWMMSCCVITATECPAISIPAGFTDEGLPVGLQLVAPPGADRWLLEVAAAVEAARPHHGRIPTC
ncbi:MAG: amidase family protein [Actinomycetota bacterium]